MHNNVTKLSPELIVKHTAHSYCSIHRITVTEHSLLQAPPYSPNLRCKCSASNSALLVLVVSVVVSARLGRRHTGISTDFKNPTTHHPLAFVRTKSLLRCFHVCPLFVLSFLSASTVFSCTSADFSKSYSFIFVYTRRLTSLVVVVVGSIHHSSAQIYRSPSLFHTEQLVVRCSTQQRTGRTTMHNKHTEQFRENPA